jgi:hypothetical protein
MKSRQPAAKHQAIDHTARLEQRQVGDANLSLRNNAHGHSSFKESADWVCWRVAVDCAMRYNLCHADIQKYRSTANDHFPFFA